MSAIIAAATVIIAMTSVRPALRPLRSAYMPSRIPPSGRTTKPAPNVAVVSISAAYSLSLGKNCFAMVIDRNPNTTKSYHSSTLPSVDAIAPTQRLRESIAVTTVSCRFLNGCALRRKAM
ncbi:hypothetical protein OKW43_004800 [Paraburkholderia sp. WC7.3g]